MPGSTCATDSDRGGFSLRAEGDVLGRQQILVAKDDDGMFEIGLPDGGNVLIGQRRGEVEPDDFGADAVGQRCDVQLHGVL